MRQDDRYANKKSLFYTRIRHASHHTSSHALAHTSTDPRTAWLYCPLALSTVCTAPSWRAGGGSCACRGLQVLLSLRRSTDVIIAFSAAANTANASTAKRS